VAQTDFQVSMLFASARDIQVETLPESPAHCSHYFEHSGAIFSTYIIVRNKPHLLVIDSRCQNFFLT